MYVYIYMPIKNCTQMFIKRDMYVVMGCGRGMATDVRFCQYLIIRSRSRPTATFVFDCRRYLRHDALVIACGLLNLRPFGQSGKAIALNINKKKQKFFERPCIKDQHVQQRMHFFLLQATNV